ncbi:ABC-type amino acid transport substrate-binding protein [Geoalkalibacter ferrihydriticus]|uniref:Solute-binding protein family 3/N-terminal domain-containing protein n=2 Tax=Geoalkalibacter ferrihydriticus TaxID=392333 RepID=A0A0C2HIK9_9BACT|nr:transporter substrate-binding domain-containing protein [Geoalkalibacter ferrihydriticus]KIH76881.1 hypothetical protein GFER_07225 [Geoalkalibacter ferrihydriticus DSM 17813]SDL46225.1 ABC-type amino acid transport substrate-binding protein [Geoalkalibacter ferrihydriticus]
MNCQLPATNTLKPLISLLVLLFTVVLSGCGGSSGSGSDPIVIAGIDMNPHVYEENGIIVGIDAEVATMVAANAGVDHWLEIDDVSFTELYNKTKAGPNRAIIGINYAESRKDDFKWVGPINRSGFHVYTKKGAVSGAGQAVAKEIPRIAAVPGWLETTTLEDQGFTNLEYFNSYEEAFTAFENDHVEAIATDLMQLAYRVRGKYSITADFDTVYSYKSAFYYMAFSKDVDDRLISSMQSALDELIISGTVYATLKKYFSTAPKFMSPDILQVFSEYAPPFNYYTGFIGNYQVAGSSVEIVKEIQKRLGGYTSSIYMTSWFDGYATVQELPNSALFTTARTPEREDLFQWVGPIAPMNPNFYTLKSANITADTLEQARWLTVTTPTQWYTHDFLKANDFSDILTTYYPADSFAQLLEREADAIYIDPDAIDWLCRERGTSCDDLYRLPIETPQRQGYIAFSLNTPKSTVDKWQQALDAMKAEGVFDVIQLGWDGSLERFSHDPALAAALDGGMQENVLKEFKRFYDAFPGLYSVQWIDTTGINRFGYPEANSLPSGYVYNPADIRDSKFLAALANRQQPSAFEIPLIEGGEGAFLFYPVYRYGQYLGVVYTIKLKN